MNSKASSPKQAREFFEAQYRSLSPQAPMRWMGRMFDAVIGGRYPRLVDLPTGAGKTEMVVIWLLTLAWYGTNRPGGQPVPRRLVWVVNRRVLVQQVFTVAKRLRATLTGDEASEVK